MKLLFLKLFQTGRLLLLLSPSLYFAPFVHGACPSEADARIIPMEASHWETMRDVRFLEYEGQNAMGLRGSFQEPGVATLVGPDFTDGKIEFDMWIEYENAMFAGIQFRWDEAHERGEYVYLRPGANHDYNTFQYYPHFKKESVWQLYGQHQRALDLPLGDWFHFRIEVHGRSMACFIDEQTQPFFFTDRLGSGSDQGRVCFISSSEVYVANMKVIPSEAQELAPLKVGCWDLGAGYLATWNAYQPILLKPDEMQVSLERFENSSDAVSIQAEERGLINFNRTFDFSGWNSAVLAEVEIHSDVAQRKQLSFGYSDRIDLYLNGQLVFSGDNTYRAESAKMRSRVHLGNDHVELSFMEGKNTLQAIVYERSGGWGMIAKLSDFKGLQAKQ